VKRLIADEKPGYPDRIELRDVEQGEALLLLNYPPPAGRHALPSEPRHFRARMAETPYRAVDEIPDVLRIRRLAARLRPSGDMVAADLIEGDLSPRSSGCLRIVGRLIIHAHYAKRGLLCGADR